MIITTFVITFNCLVHKLTTLVRKLQCTGTQRHYPPRRRSPTNRNRTTPRLKLSCFENVTSPSLHPSDASIPCIRRKLESKLGGLRSGWRFVIDPLLSVQISTPSQAPSGISGTHSNLVKYLKDQCCDDCKQLNVKAVVNNKIKTRCVAFAIVCELWSIKSCIWLINHWLSFDSDGLLPSQN